MGQYINGAKTLFFDGYSHIGDTRADNGKGKVNVY